MPTGSGRDSRAGQPLSVLDARNPVPKPRVIDAGRACAAYHDETVRDVEAGPVQCDANWAFCHAKQKNVMLAKAALRGAGDVRTWTALDSDSKMILSYEVGDRSGATAIEFMDDVRARLANRVQLTTEGNKAYPEADEGGFGGDVDYARLIKIYGDAPETEARCSPPACLGARKIPVEGRPRRKDASTSHVERHNPSMRMWMPRFTRLTDAFSKKIENHLHMLSLYYVHYYFCRVRKTLKCSPAMAAGVSETPRDMEWIVGPIDAQGPAPKRPGPKPGTGGRSRKSKRDTTGTPNRFELLPIRSSIPGTGPIRQASAASRRGRLHRASRAGRRAVP